MILNAGGLLLANVFRKKENIRNKKIALIGLGYVGLPIAIEFSKKHKVIGFDVNESRISELQK